MTNAGEKRLGAVDGLALAIVLLVGLIHLHQPFGGDQALITTIASAMNQGEVIYRDIWDAKQPGIYVFYLVGGKLFGFHEVGIHTFELLYMLSFSVVLILTLRSYFTHRALASIIPLLTVGMYYGSSINFFLTQVEALVGFPIFLALWYAAKSSEVGGRQRTYLFFSGLMGGVVLLFKLIYLPILVSFWLAVLFDSILRKKRRVLSGFVQICTPIFLGVLAPIAVFLLYCVWHGILGLVCWTYFEYPLDMSETLDFSIKNQIPALRFLIKGFSPVIAFGLFGVYDFFRGRRDLLTVNLVLWMIVGLGLVFMQGLGWTYYYFLLVVPLGILCARGLDALWQMLLSGEPEGVSRKHSIALILVVVLLFSPTLEVLAFKGRELARYGFALSKEDRLRYQYGLYGLYSDIDAEVSVLSGPESVPGPIYVFGDPLFYYLSKRDVAIRIPIWPFLLPEQLEEVVRDLERASPPYVFVGDKFIDREEDPRPHRPGAADDAGVAALPYLASYMRETQRILSEKYTPLHESAVGTWYVLRDQE